MLEPYEGKMCHDDQRLKICIRVVALIFMILVNGQMLAVSSYDDFLLSKDASNNSYFSKYQNAPSLIYYKNDLRPSISRTAFETAEQSHVVERSLLDDIHSYPHKIRHHHAAGRVARNTNNLHEPRFDRTSYRSVVDESIPIGSSVLTVTATDEDLDANGIIRYELRDTNDFRIDEGGVIYNTNHLDYESSRGTYRFSVVARNPTTNDAGTRVPVTIEIRDTPDAPVFDSTTYYFNISEFASIGDYVGTVVARDSDNDLQAYSLEDVSPPNLFIIDSQNGIITVGTREGATKYVYNIHAVASDAAGNSARVPVVVNVIDENTNKPIFENCSGYNNFPVTENQTVPEDILVVKATDADYGQNGIVEYSLLTDDPSFAIDAATGQLSVQIPLDRDRGDKEHFLTVIAKDMAEDPLQSACSFTIVVEDINDNPPVFDQENYKQTVPSDTVVNSAILRLTATDVDAGKNAEIHYSLEGDSESMQYFTIDANTGTITLKKQLLQSMANTKTFTFLARASDVGEIGQTPLTSTVGVTLAIVSPGAMPPSVVKQIPEKAFVNEDATKDTNIVSICASSNSNTSIVFMDMINGNVPETNSDGTFDIRTATNEETGCPSGTSGGNVYLATSNLDYEEIQSYTLIIQLTNDNGRSEYSLTVQVTDVNDSPPVFQQPYTGSISENVASTMVMAVKAIDKDISPEFRQLVYSFKDPPQDVTDNFAIFPDTGEIWNLKPLDREEVKKYRIPVKVTDGLNERDRQYWIVVNDQNDSPPHFNLEKGVYETQVDEDLTVGKDTGIDLVVEDADILNEFSYQIIGGNDESKFKIDPDTGIIRVNKPLDYDAPVNDRNFTLRVRVSDGKSYDTTDVKIIILNKNDLVPVFDPTDYPVIVTENVDCDINITKVYAYDPDYPENGDIVYKLNYEEQSNFTLDSKTGVITVKGCLDREATALGALIIYPFAIDEGGTGRNSEPANVNITILDVNDNYPYIQSPPNSYAKFMENIAPQDMNEVVIILLNDLDDKEKGNACPCTLAFDESTPTNVVENFNVIYRQENQYQLVTTQTLDREAQKFYYIPFLTTDNQGLKGIRTLTVEVGDQNDSPMTDGASKINVYNYKSSFPDVVIGSVYVTDADDYDVNDKIFELDPATSSDVQQYFDVNYNYGNITMKRGTPGGEYTLIVKVTDKVRNEVAKGTVHITVIDLPAEAVKQSGSFFISNKTATQVVAQESLDKYEGTSLYDRLKVELSGIFDTSPANVDIFYLSDVNRNGYKGVEVRFNAHGSPYYTASHLNGLLMQNKAMVERDLGIRIPVVDDNLCLYEDFQSCNGTSCQQELRADSNNPLLIESGTSTVVGVSITEKYTCSCGYLDPEPRACPVGVENYCYNGGTCNYSSTGGLRCKCLDQYNYGPRCELLTARFKGGFAWFDGLGTCEEPALHLTFQSDNPSAVLLYNGPIVKRPNKYYPRDFLYLVLNNWVVEAYLDLGSGTSSVSVAVNGNTAEDYDVILSWTSNTISISIPNCGLNTTYDTEACQKTVSVPVSKTSILNAGGPLQLGGLAPMLPLNDIGKSFSWDYDLSSFPPYSGCMSYLEYNGDVYDLNKTSFNKYFFRTCENPVRPSKMKMSSESVFIIVGSLLVLLLLVLLVLFLLRRRKKPHSYPDHLNEIVKETIGTTDIEGYGEKDMTQFDLKLLRVTPEGKLLNGYGVHSNLPDVAKNHLSKKAPIARVSDGFSVEDFIGDNTKKVDKEQPEFDDVRHYCFEGDEMSIASLSSLGSGSSGDEGYDYQEDWGPRFKRLAEIYGPKADEEDDSDYEFPAPQNPPKKGSFLASKPSHMTPSSGTTSSSLGSPGNTLSPTQEDSSEGMETPVPYMRLGYQQHSLDDGKDPQVVTGEYHEAVNPLGAYEDVATNKESWC